MSIITDVVNIIKDYNTKPKPKSNGNSIATNDINNKCIININGEYEITTNYVINNDAGSITIGKIDEKNNKFLYTGETQDLQFNTDINNNLLTNNKLTTIVITLTSYIESNGNINLSSLISFFINDVFAYNVNRSVSSNNEDFIENLTRYRNFIYKIDNANILNYTINFLIVLDKSKIIESEDVNIENIYYAVKNIFAILKEEYKLMLYSFGSNMDLVELFLNNITYEIIISEKHCNQTATRNFAIQYVRDNDINSYLTFSDSDDENCSIIMLIKLIEKMKFYNKKYYLCSTMRKSQNQRIFDSYGMWKLILLIDNDFDIGLTTSHVNEEDARFISSLFSSYSFDKFLFDEFSFIHDNHNDVVNFYKYISNKNENYLPSFKYIYSGRGKNDKDKAFDQIPKFDLSYLYRNILFNEQNEYPKGIAKISKGSALIINIPVGLLHTELFDIILLTYSNNINAKRIINTVKNKCNDANILYYYKYTNKIKLNTINIQQSNTQIKMNSYIGENNIDIIHFIDYGDTNYKLNVITDENYMYYDINKLNYNEECKNKLQTMIKIKLNAEPILYENNLIIGNSKEIFIGNNYIFKNIIVSNDEQQFLYQFLDAKKTIFYNIVGDQLVYTNILNICEDIEQENLYDCIIDNKNHIENIMPAPISIDTWNYIIRYFNIVDNNNYMYSYNKFYGGTKQNKFNILALILLIFIIVIIIIVVIVCCINNHKNNISEYVYNTINSQN